MLMLCWARLEACTAACCMYNYDNIYWVNLYSMNHAMDNLYCWCTYCGTKRSLPKLLMLGNYIFVEEYISFIIIIIFCFCFQCIIHYQENLSLYRYLEPLSIALENEKWSLVQPLLSSSYIGYGTSSLDQVRLLFVACVIFLFKFFFIEISCIQCKNLKFNLLLCAILLYPFLRFVKLFFQYKDPCFNPTFLGLATCSL